MPLNENFAVELHHEQFKTKVILAAAYSFFVDDYGDLYDEGLFIVFLALMILSGLILALCGYRWIKPIMFVSGLILGMVIAFLSELPLPGQIILSIACSLVCGLIVVCKMGIALCVKGLVAGFMIGHLILSTIEPYVPIADWFQYVLLGVSSLVFAGLAIRNEGPTMIVGTAGLGAHMISYGAYFATLPPVRSDGKYWIPAVITGVVAAIAIVFQFKVSARDILARNDKANEVPGCEREAFQE
ncbi:unnamed protein product, partial [Aphanomyces euteiches]